MILACPSCASKFLIDPALLGPAGRKVRCAKCKHEWLATKPLITLPPDEGSPPPFSTHDNPPHASNNPDHAQRAKRNAVIVGAVLAVLLAWPLMGLFTNTPEQKTPTEKASPRMAEKTHEGKEAITLDGVPTTLLKQEQGRTILSIEGALVNHSTSAEKTPRMRAEALDAKRRIIKEWDIPLVTETMEAGQRLPFTFTTPFNEQGVVDIAFRFLPHTE